MAPCREDRTVGRLAAGLLRFLAETVGILLDMTFRDRLLATLRALEPILTETGVLVIGSEVPNLLEPDAAATLVVSQDVDIGIAVTSHAAVKRRLSELRGYTASRDEPSVWLPVDHEGLEINFVGMDSDIEDAADAYVLEDSELPLLAHRSVSCTSTGATILGTLELVSALVAGASSRHAGSSSATRPCSGVAAPARIEAR